MGGRGGIGVDKLGLVDSSVLLEFGNRCTFELTSHVPRPPSGGPDPSAEGSDGSLTGIAAALAECTVSSRDLKSFEFRDLALQTSGAPAPAMARRGRRRKVSGSFKRISFLIALSAVLRLPFPLSSPASLDGGPPRFPLRLALAD